MAGSPPPCPRDFSPRASGQLKSIQYPDREHPVLCAVLKHRQWFLETVTELLAKTGGAPAEPAGRHLVLAALPV